MKLSLRSKLLKITVTEVGSFLSESREAINNLNVTRCSNWSEAR